MVSKLSWEELETLGFAGILWEEALKNDVAGDVQLLGVMQISKINSTSVLSVERLDKLLHLFCTTEDTRVAQGIELFLINSARSMPEIADYLKSEHAHTLIIAFSDSRDASSAVVIRSLSLVSRLAKELPQVFQSLSANFLHTLESKVNASQPLLLNNLFEYYSQLSGTSVGSDYVLSRINFITSLMDSTDAELILPSASNIFSTLAKECREKFIALDQHVHIVSALEARRDINGVHLSLARIVANCLPYITQAYPHLVSQLVPPPYTLINLSGLAIILSNTEYSSEVEKLVPSDLQERLPGLLRDPQMFAGAIPIAYNMAGHYWGLGFLGAHPNLIAALVDRTYGDWEQRARRYDILQRMVDTDAKSGRTGDHEGLGHWRNIIRDEVARGPGYTEIPLEVASEIA